MDFDQVRALFLEYASSFRGEDGSLSLPVKLKIGHTDEVCQITDRIILGTPNLSPDVIMQCRFSALFHDLSRFEQYQKYHTFRDDKSFDHGERSADMLKEAGYLSFLPEADREIIDLAIRIHNKISIPDDTPETALIPVRMVRDADKLSIMRIIIDFLSRPDLLHDPAVKLDLPDTDGFSEQVLLNVLAGKSIARKELTRVNDFVLNLFVWVYDLNFAESAKYILEKGFYPKLRHLLPDDPRIDTLLNQVTDELKKRSGE